MTTSDSPVEQAAVERVARAICDQRWGEDGQVHQPTGWDRETARAVIEALQLTEEQRVVRSICDMADPGIPERRLVGPWRTAQKEEQ